MTLPKNIKFGWKPDLPDKRDKEKPTQFLAFHLPPMHDNLPQLGGFVYDQGNLGSCTGNGIAASMMLENIQAFGVYSPFSRLFIYYNEREREHTIPFDAGASIRDGIKSVAKQGVCYEETWPYLTSRFADRPTPEAYQEALKHQAITYETIKYPAKRSPTDVPFMTRLKSAIYEGSFVVFGFTCYESFMTAEVAKTGIMPMPRSKIDRPVGGHCVVMTGYNDATNYATCLNSWGKEWGKDGAFDMPYEFIRDPGYCSDFWVIKKVAGVER